MVKRLLLLLLFILVFFVSVEDVSADCLGTWRVGICYYDDQVEDRPCGDAEKTRQQCNDPAYGGHVGCAWVDSRRDRRCGIDWNQALCESYQGCVFNADPPPPPPPEDCNNGVDDDGDGLVDLADPDCSGCSNYWPDWDQDGWTRGGPVVLCSGSVTGYRTTPNPDDCADRNPNRHPGLTEICGDGIDNDCNPGTSDTCPTEVCNGVDDDGDGLVDELGFVNGGLRQVYYLDFDSDTYGDNNNVGIFCPGTQPPNYVSNNLDCNDRNNQVYPGAPELCDNGVDNDCNAGTLEGTGDPRAGQVDSCGLGECRVNNVARQCVGSSFVYACVPGPSSPEQCTNGLDDDCDGLIDGADADCDVPPPACTAEVCDGIDNDCDGSTDEGGVCTPPPPTCTPTNGGVEICDNTDNDCDGSTDEGGVCTPPPSCTPSTEICNGLDDDCDGSTDEGGVCPPPPPSCVPSNGGVEDCDGADNDCDGSIDEGGVCNAVTYYCDGDGDNYYDINVDGTCTGIGCEPSNCVTYRGNDCRDDVASINPGRADTCNGRDDNCNSIVDENNVCYQTYYCDGDGDGFNSQVISGSCNTFGCSPCSNFQGNDCRDDINSVNPSATEICDSYDNDCDGSVNEGGVCTPVTYYCDGDGDGYNDRNADGVCIGLGCHIGLGCSNVQGNDCNDGDPNINPGRPEICNNIDDNCNGLTDTQEGPIGTWYYEDRDNDGYGSGARTNFCFDPGGFYHLQGDLSYTDCNDLRNDVYPGATEVCDGYDNDCNGPVDEGLTPPLADLQAGVCAGATKVCGGFSGWVEPNYFAYSSDYEAQPEFSCDYTDNDCDGQIDEGLQTEYFRDDDADQWLTQSGSRSECFDPGPDWYEYGELFQPATDGLWDQDDADPIITYTNCAVQGGTFIIEKNALLGDYVSAIADDWSYDNVIKPPSGFETDQFRGGCAPISNYCVFNSGLYQTNGIVIASGSTFDGSAFGYDENMFCSGNFCDAYGCAWLDYDSDQVTCESDPDHLWIEPGTNYPNIGEYDGLQTECCGDDGTERISVRSCLASTVDAPICCPNDGQDYFNLDGECVTACPDLMNSQDTFIDLNPSGVVYQAYEIALDGSPDNPNAYCCDGSEGPSAGKPECQIGESGCYTSVGIPGTQDNIQARKYFCQATPGDDYCMVETCLEGNRYQACEAFNYCNQEVNSVNYGNADQKLLCNDYAVNPLYPYNGNYFTVDASCTAGQIQNCETVTRERCTGTGCQALCQKDENGEPFNCQEVCSSYTCETITSYHGGECQIDPACNPVIELETAEDVIDGSARSCSDFGVCNQFGCAATECDIYGCPPSAQLFQLDTLCQEDFYCSDLNCAGGINNLNEPDMRCFLETVPNGNPFVLNITESSSPVLTSTYYQCNPTGAFEEGDPWCDYQVSGDVTFFDEGDNRCEVQDPAVCDFTAIVGGTPQAYTQNGCDQLTAAADDYWGNYDVDCVSSGSSTDPLVYGAACCLAFSIDQVDVYDDSISFDNAESGIRIY